MQEPAIAVARRLGDIVLGPVLGTGGMATVHLGWMHRRGGFARPVAVKMLHPHHAADLELVQLFLQEARLVGRVRHPNVVAPLDLVVESGEVPLAAFVMEYVHGVTIAELVRATTTRGRTVPPALACAMVGATLEGLHAAHQLRDDSGRPLSVIHRDVSPQNVMVGPHGEVKVLDFGVAKVVGLAPSTRTGRIKGKLGYMAPEQLQGRPLDRRADVYSAGVVLWELLTSRRLFHGESEGHIVTQVLTGEVLPPGAVVPGVPPALDRIVCRALARHPADRFESARAMAAELDAAVPAVSPRALGDWIAQQVSTALAARESMLAGVPGAATSSDQPTLATQRVAPVLETAPPPSVPARRWGRLALAVGVLALVVGGVVRALVPPPVSSADATAEPRAPRAATAPLPTTAEPRAPRAATSPPPPTETVAPAAPVEPPPGKPALAPRSRDRGPPIRRAQAPVPADACRDPYVWRDGIKYPKPECF